MLRQDFFLKCGWKGRLIRSVNTCIGRSSPRGFKALNVHTAMRSHQRGRRKAAGINKEKTSTGTTLLIPLLEISVHACTHTCGLYMRPSPHVMYHAVRTAVFSIPVRFLLLSWSGDLWHMTASITLLLKVLQSLDWPRACYTSERVVTQTQTVTALETTNHPNNKARRPAAIVTSDSKQERLGLLLIRLVRTECLIPVHLFRDVVFVGFQLLWSENECEQLPTPRRVL